VVAELARYRKIVRDHGHYPVIMEEDEHAELCADPLRLEDVFTREMRTVVEGWIALGEEKLPVGVRCIVCPGNDDRTDIDLLLDDSSRIELGEARAIDLPDGYQLVSSGFSNPTPWDTPREEPEDRLKTRLEAMVALATVSPDRMIFGFHAPPVNTPLDVCPKIDWENLVVQGQQTCNAGSFAVREVIEEHSPVLSLHGHIHESRASINLGRTLAINPGSAYDQGTLLGAVIECNGKPKLKKFRFTSG